MKSFYVFGSLSLGLLLVHVFLLLLSSSLQSNAPTRTPLAQEGSEFLAEEIAKHDLPHLEEVLMQLESTQEKIQVLSIIASYYPTLLSDIEWSEDDIVFTIGGEQLWFRKAKFLSSSERFNSQEYSRILYPYRTESIYDVFEAIPPPRVNFSATYRRSSALQIALVGGTPSQIEPLIQEFTILGKTVRLHALAGIAAQEASDEIMTLAQQDDDIARFIDELETISGYYNRTVRNSSNISMHAFGIALDFIPNSFKGKAAYWQWARDQRPDTWDTLGLDERWLIPEKIVSILQNKGFIWGGKWSHYDTMHFEYRPELIEYARLRDLVQKTM